jgi:uncharacterized protein YyaL (SSP411 family)
VPGHNRLAQEASPYLRQHADNPVDWQPWSPDAFTEARRRDVPVLLSIGYSACHWCHVMAHESFEDEATAAVMNDLFVTVKVDREERPDVDAVYMEATQAMSGHGGWPMTVFLDHDARPFHCGTYYPKESRPGMPGFVELLGAVDDAWRHRRPELLEQGQRLTDSLGTQGLLAGAADGPLPGDALVAEAERRLLGQFDAQWGGFSKAPKFPQATNLEVLARAGAGGSKAALGAMDTMLSAMAAGGIHDHLGGGFSRYSVDPIWLVPHFEKMLYDQALLARAYLHGFQLTQDPEHRAVLEGIVAYVLRDLRHSDGGFYSAEDADSEGEEGLFYTWTPDEVRATLADDDLARAALDWYGISDEANFEGRSIPNRIVHRGELARPDDVEEARRRLFEARTLRVRPGLDDKVLTEWNALMISALAEAGAALGEPDWVEAAVAAGEFLLANLRRPGDGRWLRSWQASVGGRTLAFAADHATVVDAFTRLAEATGQARWVQAARDAADALLALFWDPEEGGFLTSGRDGEQLVTAAKDLLDNATPAANSSAAVALARLAAITGDHRYLAPVEQLVRRLGPVLEQHPNAFGHLLQAVELLAGVTEVVVTGDRPDLLAAARGGFRPEIVLAWGEPYDSPLWEGRTDPAQAGLAFVCHDYLCEAPVAEPDGLLALLDRP